MADLLDDLRADLPAEVLVTDPVSTGLYARDHASWAASGTPSAVVRARTAEQVQATVQTCVRHGVPVVARGAGSGLAGGANAADGWVVVSLERMDAVLEVDVAERLAVVQPGVIGDALRQHVATFGLWYPPDPASASWSTLGGNVATNAGGLCCVKYGVTGDYVLGLQVVTGTGELVRVGKRTRKGVAGYDLTSLLVGSEGTLGIVTEVTVRLRPLREPERTIAGFFDSLVDAGRAVTGVVAAGLVPSAFELVDRHCLAAVDAWKGSTFSADAAVILLARIDTPGAAGDLEADRLVGCFEDAGATWAAVSTDQQEADALFDARRLALSAVEQLGPVLVEDVCVPVGALPEMLRRVELAAEQHDVVIATVAHAGDGNVHPFIVVPAGDEAAGVRAHAAFEQMMRDAHALGGTVTGEHGIGLLKRGGFAEEVSPEVLAMQRAVKQALDPHGILNPGKAI